MPPRTVYLTRGRPQRAASADAVGIVCERAPDSLNREWHCEVLDFPALFGERSRAMTQAAQLAHRLVADEPQMRGVQQLRAFEETLVGELEPIFLVLRLRDYLRRRAFQRCVVDEDCWLAAYADLLRGHFDVLLRKANRKPKSAAREYVEGSRAWRVLSRLAGSGFSVSALLGEGRQLLAHMDPYRRARRRSGGKRSWSEGDVWFYSTAHTFTNIALAYEPFAPAPFRFLVESTNRGGKPIKGSRESVSIYDFVTPKCVPSQGEVRAAREAIERHVKSVPLGAADTRARDALLLTPFFGQFLDRLLPLALFHCGLFDEWCARTRPAALVVGNHVFETPALAAARRHGVPTLLLQHGTLGLENSALDLPADHVVVRGRFWREFLPEDVRRRAKILNAPAEHRSRGGATKKSLLFLTAPYAVQKFWDEDDLDAILSALLRCAADTKAELIVRVHPLESVASYRRRVKKLSAGIGKAAISFSQGGSLDSLLHRSAVAVTYSSTSFIECLRWRVPIVSPGWHDFSYRQRIEKHRVFHFADSLAGLRNLVLQGLSGDLACAPEAVLQEFATATSPGELGAELERMLQVRSRVLQRTSHACNA